MHKGYYIGLSITATLLIVVGLLFFLPGFDYKLIYIPSESCYKDTLICTVDSMSQLNNCLDTIIEQKCNRLSELEMLSRLQDRGLIVSPSEYTSRVSSYYSVLVAFLVGLFVLFTILSYFSIKSSVTDEISKEKKTINKDMNDSLRELLRDSKEAERIIVESLTGKVVDEVLQCFRDEANKPEGNEDLKAEIESVKQEMKTLFDIMEDLQSDMAAKENIE